MAGKPGPVELYMRLNPKRFARNAVHVAIENGSLERGHCAHADASCKGSIEAHHESYEVADWLRVTWLCRSHHQRLHHQEPAPRIELGTARLRIGCSTAELSWRRKKTEALQQKRNQAQSARRRAPDTKSQVLINPHLGGERRRQIEPTTA